MKRPLLYCGIIFVLSTLLAVNLKLNMLISVSAALLAAGLIFLFNRKYLRVFVGIFFSFMAFLLVIFFNKINAEPYAKLYGRNIEVEGLVCGEYQRNSINYYNCKVKTKNTQGLPNNTYCLIKSFDKSSLKQGEYFKAKVKVEVPYKADTTKHYLSRNIYFTAELNSKAEIIKSNLYPLSEKAALTNLYIKENLEKYLSGDTLAVVSAMAIGNRNILDRNLEGYLRKSGVIHIIAVSGMHIAVISKLFSLIFTYIFKINSRLSGILTLPFIWCYGFICSFPPSTVRSLVMLTIAIIGDCVFRESDSLNSLGLAAIFTLCLNPYMILNAGFQMSYLAVVGISVLSNRYLKFYKSKIPKPLRPMGKVFFHSASAWIFVLPLCAIHFGYLSVLSPFANVLISPLVPATLISGMFLGILPQIKIFAPLCKLFTLTCKILVGIIITICKIISEIPFSIIIMNEFWKYIWLFAALIIFIISCVKFGNIAVRKISVLCIVVLFLFGKSFSLLVNHNATEIYCMESGVILKYQNNGVFLDFKRLPYDDNILVGVKNIPILAVNDEKAFRYGDILDMSKLYKLQAVNAPKNPYTESYMDFVTCEIFYNLDNFKYTLPNNIEIYYDEEKGYKIKINNIYILKKTENCDIIEDSCNYDIIINDLGKPMFNNIKNKKISLTSIKQGYKIKIYGEKHLYDLSK